MDIYKPSKEFNFNLFSLENPQPVQGGSYFTRVVNNNDKPLFIQLPKCTTKQGVVKTNRGLYCDLMYNKNQSDELIEWILALEILRRHDVKNELKNLMTPLIELILIEIYPYIYLSLIFVIISFLLHLGIFILLFRSKSTFRIL